jgi:hypothetical protein
VGVHRAGHQGDDAVVDQFHHHDGNGVGGQRNLDRGLEAQAGLANGEQRERVTEGEGQRGGVPR